MINRLQFRYNEGIFNTREEAIEYIYSEIKRAEQGLAANDKSFGFSLLAEPTILRYKNEKDETNPHVILAIGSNTNPGVETGHGQYADNRFCIIDTNKTESEIEEIKEELEKAIKSLTILTQDSSSLKLFSEVTEEGTVISGDVSVASSHIFDDVRRPNIIMNTENGLFAYVDMDFDDEDKLIFTVNGVTKEWNVTNNYIVNGYYGRKDESLHLLRKDGVDIVIPLEALIDEWGVEGEASKTPIVLTREEIGYGDSNHNHTEPWQDVLKADIRLADMRHNILKKSNDGRYLYVDGMADNITYFKDGKEITVAEALNKLTKGLSSDSANILYEKSDGYFATASLKYDAHSNTLTFTASNVTGGTTTETMKLNVVELFKSVYYDSVTEELVILYVDGGGDVKEVRVPIGQMMKDWEWDIVNDGHNVKLHKERVIAGSDKVSADVDIFVGNDNILEDFNHQLLVRGTASNIKYGDESNVKVELDKLIALGEDLDNRLDETSGKVETLRSDLDAEIARSTQEDGRISDKLDAEISRSKDKDIEHTNAINEIKQTIGDGFTTDGHETVTYKFNELGRKVETVSAKTDNAIANISVLTAGLAAETARATNAEKEIEDKIGDGFSIRNTVRDEIDREKSAREQADADLSKRIDDIVIGEMVSEVINRDHSINVDNTDRSKPVIKVNLSEELISGKPNIIKLNNDGLYAGVDLEYSFDEDTGANSLFFTTTNGTKKIELKTNSVVDKIYYDPTREAIIVEYTVNGKRMPDVVIPVADLISEWRVSESTNGAIKLTLERVSSGSTPGGKDVLSAEVIVSEHDDNMLVNDGGSLYVSDAQVKANKANIDTLTEKVNVLEGDVDALEDGLRVETSARIESYNAILASIENEKAARENADASLQTALDAEITRSTQEDNRLSTKLDNEISRSTSIDASLQQQITDEASTARAAESTLREGLTREVSAREVGDNNLQGQITNEINRATNAETVISDKLNEEIQARRDADNEIWASIRPIEFNDTTTVHIERVRNEGKNPDDVTAKVIVSTSDKNIIAANDNLGGVYATADLEYVEATNTLILKGTDGMVLSTQKLGPGSIIDNIYYDAHEKDLVIEYHSADGIAHSLNFPVADLFNEWDVKNPSEGSAIELHKESNTGETGTVDYIWGRVLLTGAVTRPDGTIDYGDNLIKIVNNGLYVSGSAITEVQEVSECTKSELKAVEKAVLGSEVGSCGDGYVYSPYAFGCYIKDATSMYDADKILDTYICSAHSRIDDVEVRVSCVEDGLSITQKNVLGFTVPECGKNNDGTDYTYPSHNNSCIISAATSMDEADVLLDEAVCQLKEDVKCNSDEINSVENVLGVVGNCDSEIAYPVTEGCLLNAATSFADADALLEKAICELDIQTIKAKNTVTSDATISEEGGEDVLSVDVRLSHGNDIGKWQSDEELTIKEINLDSTEFTDTNVLRVIDVVESESVAVDSNYNGLYLSNVWDCGEYTENGVGTPYEKYKIDDSEEAEKFFERSFNNFARNGVSNT